MKRLTILLVLIIPLFCLRVNAAVCGEVIAADGNMCRECALGNFAADALRQYADADIALVASGDLGIGIQPGEITADTLAESFPTDSAYVLAELTESELRAIIEESLSHITLGSDEKIDESASAWEGFLCVSGFKYSYDASAPVGSRIYDLDAGSGTLSAVIPASYADGEPCCTLCEAVASYCDDQREVTPPDTDRIKVLGANANRIVGGHLSRAFIIVLAVVVIVFSGFRYRRRLNTER